MSAPRLILKQSTGWFAAGREFVGSDEVFLAVNGDNLTDFDLTPPHVAFEESKRQAEERARRRQQLRAHRRCRRGMVAALRDDLCAPEHEGGRVRAVRHGCRVPAVRRAAGLTRGTPRPAALAGGGGGARGGGGRWPCARPRGCGSAAWWSPASWAGGSMGG